MITHAVDYIFRYSNLVNELHVIDHTIHILMIPKHTPHVRILCVRILGVHTLKKHISKHLLAKLLATMTR